MYDISFGFISFRTSSDRYGEIRQKSGRCFIWFVLEMTAGSCSLRDFLQRMGLIMFTWEKSDMCLSSNMWEKRRFHPHLFLLIVCVRKLFFLDWVGFRRCNVYCNLCMRRSIYLRERWSRCWSVLLCVRFLMVCNVVCMIGIPNLVFLSTP